MGRFEIKNDNDFLLPSGWQNLVNVIFLILVLYMHIGIFENTNKLSFLRKLLLKKYESKAMTGYTSSHNINIYFDIKVLVNCLVV